MLSRIFWVGLAGFALVAGMVLQNGNLIFSWDDHDAAVERAIDADIERSVEADVEEAVERSFDRMEVVGADGREVDVPPEAKRALAGAVGRLIKAEGRLATARITDAAPQELQAAQTARDHARADLDRLKSEIERHEDARSSERDVLRDQIRREVRDNVRENIRSAVRG